MSLRRERNTFAAMWLAAVLSSITFAFLDLDAWVAATFPFVISFALGALLTLRRD